LAEGSDITDPELEKGSVITPTATNSDASKQSITLSVHTELKRKKNSSCCK